MASSRVFRYLFNIFASGDAAVPAKGMGEIPIQLASDIPKDKIKFGMRVDSIENGKVILTNGQEVNGKTIVIATEGPETQRLLKRSAKAVSKGEKCIYFSTDKPPIDRPCLILKWKRRRGNQQYCNTNN